MIIINISGGLGNQMFQYAFGYAISQFYNLPFKLDIHDYKSYNLRKYELDSLNTIEHFASESDIESLKFMPMNSIEKFIRQLIRKPKKTSKSYYQESHFYYEQGVFHLNGSIYFNGYWQSERYFHQFRHELLEMFTQKDPIHPNTQYFHKNIINSESVSIHIRRGDYISNKDTNNFHGTCNLTYYHKAISFIKNKIKNPYFFIFSDDPLWTKENFNFIDNISFVTLAEDIPDYEEIYLMSQCKHNIIANSSFSWWGAWLNQNNEKLVIAPQQWFADKQMQSQTNDLLPKTWIKL